jgi:hypothetical protein
VVGIGPPFHSLGTPSPLRGYFARKLFRIMALEMGCACKLLIPDGLLAKYYK